MASRPGFQRTDTDQPGDTSTRISSTTQSKTYELEELDTKGNATSDVKKIDSDPDEEIDAPRAGSVSYDIDHELEKSEGFVVETAADLSTKIVTVEDDPTERAITFRVLFLGVGLSVFGSVLQEIFYFKPQTIFVSVVFLTVIAYVLGDFMALIPQWGPVGRFLNPGPFTSKEHVAITIMASAAAQSALATEALAAQDMFYGGYPSTAAGIFIVLSSQIMGFGVAGTLRSVLVWPTKMIWPQVLPINTLLETIHKDRSATKRRLKVWWVVFIAILVWEILPEYIFPLLIGVSVFCLADNNNLVFSNIFGGATANEGLGVGSISLDWNYIASFYSPLWYPLKTTVNQFLGILLCWALFSGTYYGNVWNAQNFPWMAQNLFNESSSTSTNFSNYDQTLILNQDLEIDYDALAVQGPPALTATYLIYLLTSNMGFSATIVHMLYWNLDDLKGAWSWATLDNLRGMFNLSTWSRAFGAETPEERYARLKDHPDIDPHYKLMLRNKYVEVPQWWWVAVLAASWIVGITCLYVMKSTLPWWGFILATIFSYIYALFFSSLYGLTGFAFNLQPISQMLAGYIFPGRPLANFYFTCFTYNTNIQTSLLARDVRTAQNAHLDPKATFWLQIGGCIVGGLMNWVMMYTIVQNQFATLIANQGTSIWSGQNVQQFNALAISWSIAPHMYSVGAKYQWVTIAFLLGFLAPVPFILLHRATKWEMFSYINTSIILWFAGNLFVGINSSFLSFWIIAFVFQYYIRKYKPKFFVEYNYLLSAALDGGTQICVFILTFAVAGGSGVAHPFPYWWGNPDPTVLNSDRCMVNPANNG